MKIIKKRNPKWGKGKSSWNKGIAWSQATRDKISASMKGTLSPSYGRRGEYAHNWRGDKVCNSAMHKWVERCKGLAKNHLCQHCGKVRAKDWANCRHDYKRKLDDYAALCRQCHRDFDKAMEDGKINRRIVIKTFGKTIVVKGKSKSKSNNRKR